MPGGSMRTMGGGAGRVRGREIKFGPFAAAGKRTHKKCRRRAAARQRKDRRQEAGAQRPRLDRSRSVDCRQPAHSGRRVSPYLRAGSLRTTIMTLPREDAATLSTKWTEGVLLKRDVFSTVELGRYRT